MLGVTTPYKIHQILAPVPITPDRMRGGLYVRGRLRATIPRPQKARFLTAHDIRAICCAIPPRDPDLAALTLYRHAPLPDNERPDLAGALACAEWVVARMMAGANTLVHCYAGRNRSGMIATLVVMILNGCSGAEAIRLVRAGRPGALANPHMVAMLEPLTAEPFPGGSALHFIREFPT